ncbi:putative protein-disulfide reductase [Lupinus albus]|uniref:protein-disulfide reductase n=1 Tax=Lupinus albus TaxID=3870 RepID=A0A6A4QLR1_LUPAL|nr:putative protein-disulfide reductase [Lupinus albus]
MYNCVKIDSLKGKKVGIYFSASWCGPCQHFTPFLVEVYNELAPKGEFEVIFVSADEDDESFKAYFSKMPWLAIPFFDSDARKNLDELFDVKGIPQLVILNESGKVVNDCGTSVIREYGAEGYPFTSARMQNLKDQEDEAKRNQTLISILTSPIRDFVISSEGKKIPVSDLEGKVVGLYFSLTPDKACIEFTPKLVEIYEKLKVEGEEFEVVMIPQDDGNDGEEEESFKEWLQSFPWLSLPFKDRSCEKLCRYFELSTIPTLVIIGPDGKTLHYNIVEFIEEHGVAACPFTPEKIIELNEIQKAKDASQTLESILVSADKDFVIGKDGVKIKVSELVGKNILLYFSARWSSQCTEFLPELIKVYHNIKANGNAFEIIFISDDEDQASFDGYFAEMPWLALPYDDSRVAFLNKKFKIYGIPHLVAIGSNGTTITQKARGLVSLYGTDAYPFTEERIKEIEAEYEKTTKGWPEKVTYDTHKHELVLTRRSIYTCDGCDDEGNIWSYYCDECEFDLHPKCAFEKGKGSKDDAKEENKSKDGWVCDGIIFLWCQFKPLLICIVSCELCIII